MTVFSVLYTATKADKCPDNVAHTATLCVAHTVDKFMRFYYNAVAHRCTQQGELCCLLDSLGPEIREQQLVPLITPHTVSPPGDSGSLAYTGGEGSAHLRD